MLKKNSKTFAIALCMTTMVGLYVATPAWAADGWSEDTVNGVTSTSNKVEIAKDLEIGTGSVIIMGSAE